MCFKQKDKWQKFEPTQEYLDVVKLLTSIVKLWIYSKDNFVYIAEQKDKWKTPIEFMNDGGGDCEDWARWYVDILVRIIKQDKARFIIYSGYNHEKNGNELKGHAITAFPYYGKLAIFSNNKFYSGFSDYVEIGHKYYPDGLRSMEVRNSEGKILEKKRPLFGTF